MGFRIFPSRNFISYRYLFFILQFFIRDVFEAMAFICFILLTLPTILSCPRGWKKNINFHLEPSQPFCPHFTRTKRERVFLFSVCVEIRLLFFWLEFFLIHPLLKQLSLYPRHSIRIFLLVIC